MQIEKRNSFLLLLLIISGICSFLWLEYYTIPHETINYNELSPSEYLNFVYLNNHPKFDYLQGLWMAFTGIMMFSIISILELPDRFNELKQDIITFIYLKSIHILVDRKTGLQKTIYHG